MNISSWHLAVEPASLRVFRCLGRSGPVVGSRDLAFQVAKGLGQPLTYSTPAVRPLGRSRRGGFRREHPPFCDRCAQVTVAQDVGREDPPPATRESRECRLDKNITLSAEGLWDLLETRQ
jgi:hypothetical protein